jgi:hypothetical protein
MTQKKSTTIPLGSLTEKYLPADYSDVYIYKVNSEKEIIPDDIMVNFWIDYPAWVNALFKLRNYLVKFVGLKSSEGSDVKEIEKCIRTGQAYRLASVPAKSDNETVLLLSDTHLDAYISVYVEDKKETKIISLITLVHFKNRLGRIYFFVVRPFHGVAVKNMLKRAVNKVVDSAEK